MTELWIKHAELSLVEEGAEAGIVEGVLVDSNIPEREIEHFLEAQEGPLAIPLTSETEADILAEAQSLFHISNRIMPILNFKPYHLGTLRHLFRLGIGVACRVESPLDGWLAAKAGASLLLSKPEPFAFLPPQKWRMPNEREVPLFLELEESIDQLWSSPVPIQGAIVSGKLIQNWIRQPALVK